MLIRLLLYICCEILLCHWSSHTASLWLWNITGHILSFIIHQNMNEFINNMSLYNSIIRTKGKFWGWKKPRFFYLISWEPWLVDSPVTEERQNSLNMPKIFSSTFYTSKPPIACYSKWTVSPTQLCRLSYEMMHYLRYDASDRVKSLDAIYFYPGQLPHRRIAVMNNSPVKPSGMQSRNCGKCQHILLLNNISAKNSLNYVPRSVLIYF